MAGAKSDVKLGFWVGIGVVLALAVWALFGRFTSGALAVSSLG